MKPEQVLLKRAENELVEAAKYIEYIDDGYMLHPAEQAYNKMKLLGVKKTLEDIGKWHKEGTFVLRGEKFIEETSDEPILSKELVFVIQETLAEMSKYLEWQENNLNVISEDDVQKLHLQVSQRVAQTLLKVRGLHKKDDWWKHEPKGLDIDKQAEIKTAYGSILVIGKNQDEVAKEDIKDNEYGRMGYCEKCSNLTGRTKVVDILPFAGEGGMRTEFECVDCARKERETRERNDYVDGIRYSQLF